MYTQLMPDIHIVEDCELLESLREEHQDIAEHFMSFYDWVSQQWIVALWVCQLRGQVSEVFAYSDLTTVTVHDMAGISFRLNAELQNSAIKREIDSLVATKSNEARAAADRRLEWIDDVRRVKAKDTTLGQECTSWRILEGV